MAVGEAERTQAMEAAYIEYRRACSLILWKHAQVRGLLDALATPVSFEDVAQAMGFRPERREQAELLLRALERFGAVSRAGDGRYAAVPDFAPADVDHDLVAVAISARAVDDLMHSETFRGVLDALQQEQNVAAAAFDASHMTVWEEFLSQPFYAYFRHSAVAAVAAPGAHVLDLGCGPGFGLVELAGAVGPDGSVLGVEVSEDFVAEARRRSADLPNVTVVHGNLEDGLPVEDAGRDGAILIGAMHFIHDHGALFGSIARALKPGARLGIGYAYLRRGSSDQELMDLRFALREPRPAAIDAERMVVQAAEQGLELRDRYTLGCFGSFVFERKGEPS
jgi:SAM-dependent methyltransferase